MNPLPGMGHGPDVRMAGMQRSGNRLGSARPRRVLWEPIVIDANSLTVLVMVPAAAPEMTAVALDRAATPIVPRHTWLRRG
jgi:hypothetical protein